jgi:lipid-A-disaccharide synthase-like uncharacterized protein
MVLAAFLDNFWQHLNGGINYWTVLGLTGNLMFTSRFVVQWYVSERLKKSVIPGNFWRLSFIGGVINLVYAVHIGAIPFILGSILPPVIAARNLMLIAKNRRDGNGVGPGADHSHDAPDPDDASAAPTAVNPELLAPEEGEGADRRESVAGVGR